MQDKLLDYLLGCLEAEEAAAVECALKEDGEMARQLGILRLALEPLRHIPEPLDPAAGLAVRTYSQVLELRLSQSEPNDRSTP